MIETKKPRSVNRLVALLKEQLHISEKQALEKIMDLEIRGEIRFAAQPLLPSLRLRSYVKTSQALWYWITTIIALVTSSIVFLVPGDLPPWSFTRYILGAIFLLYLPGYVLIKTLFPSRMLIKVTDERLDKTEKIALSLGTSVVITPIIGLFLNYTPWGISLATIVGSQLLFTLIFATTALIREHQIKIKI
jgi:uncharacterized membrane protein